ncbi:MAG: hypothetical protein H6908_03360 [Hyphomicrobiales bacterium]|nr:hypothetical protein [Hyphomicrobiales bacterium]
MFGFFKGTKQKDLEFFKEMMSAAAEGEQRAKINSAIGSLGIQLEPENDNSQYCIKVSSALVKKIMMSHGTTIKSAENDDILTAGLFLFVVSNHITRVVGAPFEEVSSIAVLDLFYDISSPQEIAEYVNPIANLYNDASTNSKIPLAIGQNLVKWIEEPIHENYTRLVELYKLCRENLK